MATERETERFPFIETVRQLATKAIDAGLAELDRRTEARRVRSETVPLSRRLFEDFLPVLNTFGPGRGVAPGIMSRTQFGRAPRHFAETNEVPPFIDPRYGMGFSPAERAAYNARNFQRRGENAFLLPRAAGRNYQPPAVPPGTGPDAPIGPGQSHIPRTPGGRGAPTEVGQGGPPDILPAAEANTLWDTLRRTGQLRPEWSHTRDMLGPESGFRSPYGERPVIDPQRDWIDFVPNTPRPANQNVPGGPPPEPPGARLRLLYERGD